MTQVSKQDIDAASAFLSNAGSNPNSLKTTSDYSNMLSALSTLYGTGSLKSLAPLLPLLLRLKGKPYSLEDYFPMLPMFNLTLPRSVILRTGRQISKSTTLAAQGCIQSATVPYLSTLFVLPRFEQTRRFSNNYIKPFLTDTPLEKVAINKSAEQSVLQRTFKNGSVMHFSYAFLDASRIRGISSDAVAIDESVRYGTPISTPQGRVKIEDLDVGDSVYAIDANGRTQLDTVITNSDHGVRDCYGLTLSDGSTLECTSDSFVATTIGWRRVSTIIKELGSCTDVEDCESYPAVRAPARLETACIQPGEVPGIIGVRKHSTVEASECRLRGILERVQHAKHPGTTPYRVLVSPQSQEARDTSRACPQPIERPNSTIHGGLHETGGEALGFLADAEGHSHCTSPREDQTQRGQDLLVNRSDDGAVRDSRWAAEILPGARDPSEICGEAEIVAIEWMGKYRVRDIETEKYHTFFAGGVAVHNCQDMDISLLPVILETLSASHYNIRQYTGTPLTMDNTIEELWGESSMAEWVIPCVACGHWNVAALEYDLMDMIQKDGLSCAKCQRLVDSRAGHWEHRHSDRRNKFAGYHVPQPILPLHYDPDPQTGVKEKWADLWSAKQVMDRSKFYNEKLGEACDVRVNLLTRKDLINASTLRHNNDLRDAVNNSTYHPVRTLGVDWGGGGESGISYTSVAVMGHSPNGRSDCLYMERLVNVGGHVDEARRVMHLFNAFNCNILAHDYGGSGAVRETIMVQMGFPLQHLMPLMYIGTLGRNIVSYHGPKGASTRAYYTTHKARSLVLMCQCVKYGVVRFPHFDTWEGYSKDFLALVEDKRKNDYGSDVYLVTRKANASDDTAHAVNFALLAHWHANNAYPNLSSHLPV